MNILITGGAGFIGSHVADIFHKEGHKILIIDNLFNGDVSNIKVKHTFYKLDINDPKCEEVFSSNHIDLVIHLAGTNNASGITTDPYIDARNNLLGLVNILHLSSKYEVSKFINISSTEVYGLTPDVPLTEESICYPSDPYANGKLSGEMYCSLWKEKHKLDVVTLRVSNVYGPRQKYNDFSGVMTNFIYNAIHNNEVVIHGTGLQSHDFIYVDDVAYAIYRASEFTTSSVINISSNSQCRVVDIVSMIKRYSKKLEVKHLPISVKSYNQTTQVSNQRAAEELHWHPIKDMYDGVEKTYRFLKESSVNGQKRKSENNFLKRFLSLDIVKKMIPYVENIGAFCLVVIIIEFMRANLVSSIIDFRLIYIIVIGMVYGLKQVSISILLSIAHYVWGIKYAGADLLSLVYNVETLLHFSIYLFIGSVTGYNHNSKKFEVEEKEDELTELNDKFNFLFEMYNEIKVVRNELQEQILSSKDSFGKIYNVTSKLESLNPDRIYSSTVSVIEEVLDVKDVYIFSVTEDHRYLRLISKSSLSAINIKKSVPVESSKHYMEVIENKEIYINKSFEEDIPTIIIPIIMDDKVLTMIFIYSIKFEDLTLYKQNLIKVIGVLITNAMNRAYRYEHAMNDKKFINNTKIMYPEYFNEILEHKLNDSKEYSNMMIVLKFYNSGLTNLMKLKFSTNIARKIEKQIRDFDYLGLDDNNDLFLILTNTTEQEASFVINRFKKMDVFTEVVKEENLYGNDFYTYSKNIQ